MPASNAGWPSFGYGQKLKLDFDFFGADIGSVIRLYSGAGVTSRSDDLPAAFGYYGGFQCLLATGGERLFVAGGIDAAVVHFAAPTDGGSGDTRNRLLAVAELTTPVCSLQAGCGPSFGIGATEGTRFALMVALGYSFTLDSRLALPVWFRLDREGGGANPCLLSLLAGISLYY